MKKVGTIVKIVGVLVLVGLLIMLSPFALLLGAIGIWYFTKKKPDLKKRNYSIALTIVGVVGTIILGLSQNDKTEVHTPKTSEVSTASKKSVTTTKFTTTKTTTAKTTTAKTTTAEVKNDGPEYTKESNSQFATYYMEQVNAILAESGVQVRVEYYDKALLYVFVPQDIKYASNAEIQQIADSLYQTKEKLFTDWAIENGYDLGFTNSPALYVKSEDGTVLAEESGILEKSMKRKIDN